MAPSDDTSQDQGCKQADLTYGEKAVGMSFNPSQLVCVASIKSQYANIIDELNLARSESEDSEAKRLCSVAITEAQTAQMWAVKALTWNIKEK